MGWRFENGYNGWQEPLCPLQTSLNYLHEGGAISAFCCSVVCQVFIAHLDLFVM